MSGDIKHIKAINDLTFDDRNANKGTARGSTMLERSLREYGAGRSILVDRNGKVIAGNKTLENAAGAGIDDLLVVQTDGTKIVAVQRIDLDMDSDSRARELALADNRVGQVSLEWDASMLAELGGEIDLSTFWSRDELADILDVKHEGDGGDDFDTTPQDGPTRVQPGELWQLGRHRLLCGDSTNREDVERLMAGERADTLLFDPPWDAEITPPDGYRSILAFGDGSTVGNVVQLFGTPIWLFVWDCVSSWYTPNRPLRRMKLCAWYGDLSTYDFDGYHYGDAGGVRDVRNTRGEYSFVPDPRGKHLSDVFSQPITQLHAESEHSHSKPIDWITLLIANCTRGDVYDPFLGSGTTLIACERTGRRCYGIEIEPRYCDVILRRWEAEANGEAVRVDA